MQLAVVTGPAVEPVAVDDLASHLRVTWNDDDAYLDGLVTAARVWCEHYTNRAFITARYRYSLPRFISPIRLPRPKLQSVVSIGYTDSDGNSQTVSSSDYDTFVDVEPGEIHEAYSATWPSTRAKHNAVIVTYDAGYGDAAADVPETLKVAIKMLASHWYENRVALDAVQMYEVPLGVKSLLNVHRVKVSDASWFAGY